MLKKAAFCMMALSLLLVSGSALQAQKDDFSIQLPAGSVQTLPKDFKLSLPNAADLSEKELEAALQKGCSAGPADKFPTFCIGWSGVNCTGTGVAIPCGFQANGVFASLSTGCTTSYGLIGTQWYRFLGFPDNTCITPNGGAVFSAVACTTP